MPARSKAQQRFMAMCAHNPKHAQGTCPPPDVAREFARAPNFKRLPTRAKRRRP